MISSSSIFGYYPHISRLSFSSYMKCRFYYRRDSILPIIANSPAYVLSISRPASLPLIYPHSVSRLQRYIYLSHSFSIHHRNLENKNEHVFLERGRGWLRFPLPPITYVSLSIPIIYRYQTRYHYAVRYYTARTVIIVHLMGGFKRFDEEMGCN